MGTAWAAAKATRTNGRGTSPDSHCEESGANKNHSAACVDKCLKGGSKAQIRSEADGNYYNLKEFDSQVRALVGKRVTITGTIDPSNKTITVKEARAAPAASAVPSKTHSRQGISLDSPRRAGVRYDVCNSGAAAPPWEHDADLHSKGGRARPASGS